MASQSRLKFRVETLLLAMAGSSGGEMTTQLEKTTSSSSPTMVHGTILIITSGLIKVLEKFNVLFLISLKEIGVTESTSCKEKQELTPFL